MTRVELSLACQNLLDRDVGSRSDPLCVLLQEAGGGRWAEVRANDGAGSSAPPGVPGRGAAVRQSLLPALQPFGGSRWLFHYLLLRLRRGLDATRPPSFTPEHAVQDTVFLQPFLP